VPNKGNNQVSHPSKDPLEVRPVFGYEDSYEVDSSGNVYSLKGIRQELKPQIYTNHKRSYAYVNLYTNGKFKGKSIHRIVLTSFLGYKEGFQVNHKNKNSLDNRLENLEWMTLRENMEHAFAKTYKFLSPNKEIVEIYNLEKFCFENNLDPSNMNKVFNGKRKSCKGWTTTL
jgi:hypothetical protein